LLDWNPVLKILDQPPLSFIFKNPAKKNGILPLQTEGACLSQPISWSMAAILRDSVVVVVVVVVAVVVAVVRTRPRAIPLAMITMRKSIHGFPFLSYMGMGLRLAAFRAAGAPLSSDHIASSSLELIENRCFLMVDCWPSGGFRLDRGFMLSQLVVFRSGMFESQLMLTQDYIILFGVFNDHEDFAILNNSILTAKSFIYKCKFNKSN